ncbi:hypothetical protein FHS01_004206 [Longimicrobium terrae]|uniref:Uncharacterized protein n=1 Tax=Longimicrobium terrae TaxID=1639882 RepID=A0A841H3Z3_9BACT|nr:hypothetical protein [Longimicrobium terrae]MBB6072519.1 hypothetical protein [Longimicrobium terrae]
MRNPGWGVFFCIAVVLMEAAFFRCIVAQTQEPLVPLGGRWEERRPPRRALSGVLVPGVMTGDQDALVDPAQITVLLPPNSAGMLCVVVNSQDGRYWARAMFEIRPSAGHSVLLTAPRRYRNEFRRYRVRDLVISATLTPDCRDDLATHALPLWGSRAASHDSIFVYINSRDFTNVSWRSSAGEVQSVGCRETGDSYVVYSRVCRVPVWAVGERTVLRIRRNPGGGRFAYDSVFVGTPAGIRQ